MAWLYDKYVQKLEALIASCLQQLCTGALTNLIAWNKISIVALTCRKNKLLNLEMFSEEEKLWKREWYFIL